MTDLGETVLDSTEGEKHKNSQVKGPNLDKTLESVSTQEAIGQPRIFQVPIQRCNYRDTIITPLFLREGNESCKSIYALI